jgi:Tol biopolymer transport system component
MRTRVLAVLTAVMSAGVLNGCAYVTRATETQQGLSPAGESTDFPDLSYDGRYVAFDSTAALDPTDTNGVSDVFVRDNRNGAITRVSVATDGGAANDLSGDPAISDDGRFVVFESLATNLTANDANGVLDIFWHDRDNDADGVFDEPGAIRTVAASTNGGTTGNNFSNNPSISADGTLVLFESFASDLESDPPDTNGFLDIYGALFDVATGQRVTGGNVSVNNNLGQQPVLANGPSRDPDIRGDAQAITFATEATNLTVGGDTNNHADVVVKFDDPGFGVVTVPVTGPTPANADQFTPRFVGNSTKVVYASAASNLAPGDTDGQFDVFVSDYGNGIQFGGTTCISRTPTGSEANGASLSPSASADGTRIAFASSASDLVSGDTNTTWDVFVYSSPGFIQRASTTFSLGEADGASLSPAISGDGRYVAFTSTAHNLETPDTNPNPDIFVRAAIVPEIDSVCAVDPNTLVCSDPAVLGPGSHTILILGRGFGLGVTVLLGAGVSVTSTYPYSSNALVVTVNVAGSAAPGPRDASVANPGSGIGPTSGAMRTCANCLTIEVP